MDQELRKLLEDIVSRLDKMEERLDIIEKDIRCIREDVISLKEGQYAIIIGLERSGIRIKQTI